MEKTQHDGQLPRQIMAISNYIFIKVGHLDIQEYTHHINITQKTQQYFLKYFQFIK